MHFTPRPGRLNDVPRCLELLARTPFRSYEHHAALTEMLKTLPLDERMVFVVVEDRAQPERGVAGFAASVYLDKGFLDELIARPGMRLWTTLVERFQSDPSVVLSRERIGRANAAGGLHGFSPFHVYDRTWIGDPGKLDEKMTVNPTTLYFRCILDAFLEAHRGNRHQTFHKEIFHPRQLQMNEKNGYSLMRDLGSELFLIEVTKESCGNVGGWLSPIFEYHRPAMRFSDRERELLRRALQDSRIDSLAAVFGVARDTINVRRREIRDRAQLVFSHLDSFADVLKHVKQFPEELRPYVE